MAKYPLSYGYQHIDIEISEDFQPDVILPQDPPADFDPLTRVIEALDHPILDHRLESISPSSSAAIAVNDKTRPVPHLYLLPPLLNKLETLGIPSNRITLLVATGTHKPMRMDEIRQLLPKEICDRYRVISHDCDDQNNLVYMGKTQVGTKVWGNKHFLDADVRIVTGNIEPHHFMGFSGGVKSASIGLTGRETINANHSMLLNPASRTGAFETNPMRMDVEEIGRILGVNFALNAILNNQKKIVNVLAGEPYMVMQEGIQISRRICQIPVAHSYDLVLASVGGAPKDINLYQSQKALTHASLITRDGGTVILVAACPEGVGSALLDRFMEGVHSPDEALAKFQRTGFRVGPHKAFQIAREAKRIHIKLISKLKPEDARKLFMEPYNSLEEAFSTTIKALPDKPKIAILPRSTITIPLLNN
jgi:lactate racemase